MGRIPAGSPEDKAEEAMRGISKSPFAQWIVEEVKPKTFNAPVLDKFQGKTDPISHLPSPTVQAKDFVGGNK